jgi:hypothetical protein
MNRLRLMAGIVTLAGGAIVASPTAASSTMVQNPLRTRFCCGFDSNGDGKAESYCCYDTGCSAGPFGCVRAS